VIGTENVDEFDQIAKGVPREQPGAIDDRLRNLDAVDQAPLIGPEVVHLQTQVLGRVRHGPLVREQMDLAPVGGDGKPDQLHRDQILRCCRW